MTAPASREELVEAIVRGFETADQWQDLGWAGKKLYRKFASAALAAIEAAGCAVVPVERITADMQNAYWRARDEDGEVDVKVGLRAAIKESPYREKQG